MTASWCGTPGRTQGKPALPWSQVGQRGGPTTHHDHVMVVARLVAPKASQRYLGPRFGLMGGTLRASTLTNHVKPMTASWCGTPGRTQGKPALPWSQVGQRGGPTTHHDHVMVVARLVAPKASQRYLGPRFGLMGTPCHQVAA
ncbi:hypothetical protein EMCRGX_G018259 [Ephydatia muelleri]